MKVLSANPTRLVRKLQSQFLPPTVPSKWPTPLQALWKGSGCELAKAHPSLGRAWGPGGHLGDMVEGETIVTLSLWWAGCVRRTEEDKAGRAEEQTLEHRQCLRQPPPSEASRQDQLAFSQSYSPLPPLELETLTISTKKRYEVKFQHLGQEANFHRTAHISARNFGINSHWRKINEKLPKARIQRPRTVSLPDIIPLRIRWRESTSLIRTDANRE